MKHNFKTNRPLLRIQDKNPVFSAISTNLNQAWEEIIKHEDYIIKTNQVLDKRKVDKTTFKVEIAKYEPLLGGTNDRVYRRTSTGDVTTGVIRETDAGLVGVGVDATSGVALNVGGVVNITDTTDSTTLSTGAMQIAGGVSVAKNIIGPKSMLTSTGGLAVLLTNKTGGVSVKGEVVTVYDNTAIDNAVEKIVVDIPNPVGVFYESGVADGAEAWVVVSGIADVYFVGNSTRGHIARGFVTSDAGYVAGQALSEAFPTSPFATDKHFFEIGHVLQSRTGAGLAKCVLHFN